MLGAALDKSFAWNCVR